MFFSGRATCVYRVCRAADYFVVSSVLLCLQVGQVRPTKSGSFAGSGYTGAACAECQHNLRIAYVWSGAGGIQSRLRSGCCYVEAFEVASC